MATRPVVVMLLVLGLVAAWLGGWLGTRPAWLEATEAGVAGSRRCEAASRVTYTNGACPAGSVEMPLTGTLTVLPATQGAAPPAPGASRLPNARELLQDPRAAELRDRRMEQVIGK